VHLQGSRKAYFRLWAENSAIAAQIVELLPTKKTIEFENAIEEPEIVIAWRVPAAGLLVLLAAASIAVLTWMAVEHRGLAIQEPAATRLPPTQTQPTPAVPTTGPEAVPSVEDAFLADQDLVKFGARIESLSTEFQVSWKELQFGMVSQETFADELDKLLRPQWDALEAQVRRTGAAQGSARERADHELMAVINNWQLALYAYADDLRARRQVVKSFEFLGRADERLNRARRMQSDLERRLAAPLNPR
jgi:hypothetical protein